MAEASIKRKEEQKGSNKRPREPSPEPVNLAAENILKRQRAGDDKDAAPLSSTGPGRAVHPEKASNSAADSTRQDSNKRSDLKPSGLLEKALENMRGSQQLKNGDPRSAARREEFAAQPVQRPMLGRETLSALLMKKDGEQGHLPDVGSSSEDSLDDEDWQDEDDDDEEGEGEGEEGEDNSLGYEYREVVRVAGDDDDEEEEDAYESDEDDPRVTLINGDGHAETRPLSEWSPEDLANNPDW